MRAARSLTLSTVLALAAAGGCNRGEPADPVPLPNTTGTAPDTPDREFEGKLSDLINDTSARYRPLRYEYNEGLLAILDRVEARLAGKSEKLDPLPLPKLSEAEQLDHFREVVRRWSAATGKDLRAELTPLLADVAARKPGGSSFHPDFQKKFSAAFDSFIPIEVAEIRERRNRTLHDAAKPLLDEYRARAPAAVRNAEQTLNTAPYDLPVATPPRGVR